MKTVDKIKQRVWVAHVDDERNIGNSIIVTLNRDFYFKSERGCGVKGFDTWKEAEEETRKANVYLDVARGSK